MKDLILTFACDQPPKLGHRLQAKLLHSSVRRSGYKGDFLVVHNQAETFFDHTEERANDLEIHYNPELGRDRHRIQGIKMHLDKYVDFSKWERIMFCDTDVLFLSSPAHFFNDCDADISYAYERGNASRRAFNSCWTPQQMKKLLQKRRHGINSGQFVVRNHKANEVWATWRNTLENEWYRNSKLQDQSPFNKMIHSDVFSSKALPPYYVKFPFQCKKVSSYWDAKLLHFCGWSGSLKMRIMLQEYLGHNLVKKGGNEVLALELMSK